MLVPFAMGAAFVAGCLVTWVSSDGSKRREAPVPPDVVKAVLAFHEHKATAPELRAAATKAARVGHRQLGQALWREAQALAGAAQAVAGVELDRSFPSPVHGVDDAAWTRFVKRAQVAKPDHVSRDGRLGVFALSARDLGDVGIMVDVRKTRVGGRPVWCGSWAVGHALPSFLGSPQRQYEAFVALTRRHIGLVDACHAAAMGTVVDGAKVTQSGLLAVARRAGRGGLARWLSSPVDRKAFPETTAAFHNSNGLF